MRKINKDIPEVPFSLEMIIKGMPEHVYAFSEEGKLLTWNKNVEILSGYSGDELKNIFVSELLYKEDKEMVVERFMKLLAEGDDEERVIEYRIQTKSGKVIPVIAMRSLLHMNGNKYVAGILIDISKIQSNKEKLKARIAEITHVKRQLEDYYYQIDKLNQSYIELEANQFINAKAFSSKLINSLPGIFYVYEKIGGEFFLKKWNNSLESKLGYSNEELFNMQPYQFFNKKVYEKVEKAIMQIFSTGSTIQVKAPMIFKNGQEIPYLFEAYKFENKDSLYFMGVGLDVSIQYELEQKQKRQQRAKRKAKEKLNAKKRELVANALQISKTSAIIKYTQKQIDTLLVKHKDTGIFNDLRRIKKDLALQESDKDNWEVFRLLFTQVHKDFFTKLKALHSTLTKSELKFCAYIRIHLSSSQISAVLNVTNEAIKKTRYRIRKKMGLPPKDSLEDYIAKF